MPPRWGNRSGGVRPSGSSLASWQARSGSLCGRRGVVGRLDWKGSGVSSRGAGEGSGVHESNGRDGGWGEDRSPPRMTRRAGSRTGRTDPSSPSGRAGNRSSPPWNTYARIHRRHHHHHHRDQHELSSSTTIINIHGQRQFLIAPHPRVLGGIESAPSGLDRLSSTRHRPRNSEHSLDSTPNPPYAHLGCPVII